MKEREKSKAIGRFIVCVIWMAASMIAIHAWMSPVPEAREPEKVVYNDLPLTWTQDINQEKVKEANQIEKRPECRN